MPIVRTYQCPDCSGTFDHLHMRSDEAPPNFCALCGAPTTVDRRVTAPHIAGLAGKSGDQVYRAMEESSAYRADVAAEQLGVSSSDVAAMKVTDMKDNMREGDTAAVSVQNEVSRHMQTTGVGGLQQNAQAHGAIQMARQNGLTGAGNAAREGIVAHHKRIEQSVVANGRMGSFG